MRDEMKETTELPAKTSLFFGLFRVDDLKRFSLTQADVIALYWFFKWALSGNMKRDLQGNGVFFWVDYSFAADNLFTNVRAIRDSFDRLCGVYRGELLNPGMVYPLTKRIITTGQGKRNYFGFIREPFNQIVELNNFSKEERCFVEKSMNSIKLIEAGPELTGKKHKVMTQEMLDLLEDIVQIHQRGKDTPLLFTNRMPKKTGKYTETLLEAAMRLRSIYEGRFARDYRVGGDFVERNSALINDNTWKTLSGMKGSWESVRKGVFEAARNYRQWFWPENEPETKDWLPRDITTWLFDSYNQTSIFLACLNRGPYPVREKAADRVYDSIPQGVRELAEDLYQPGWDAVVFWLKIKDIVGWFESNRTKLEKLDNNIGYWFDGGLVVWFKRYKSWLRELAGQGIFMNQIGIDNPTWNAWCTWGAKKHNFRLEIFKK